MHAAQSTVRQLFQNEKGENKRDQMVSESFHAREPNETHIMKARPATSTRIAMKSHSINTAHGQQTGSQGGSFKFSNRPVF